MRTCPESRSLEISSVVYAFNQYLEIDPELAIAFDTTLAVGGRTANNLLGYPGIWRGTLDAISPKINYEVYKVITLAIANAF